MEPQCWGGGDGGICAVHCTVQLILYSNYCNTCLLHTEPTGPMHFAFCRLYPVSSQPPRQYLGPSCYLSTLNLHCIAGSDRVGFRSGQVGSGRVRSGQIRTGQVSSGLRWGYEKGIWGPQKATRFCMMRKSFTFVASFKIAAPILCTYSAQSF